MNLVKTIKLYNQNHLTLLSVRLLTLYSALYLPLPLLLLWLVLTLLYTKEGFFLCHTRYTNTTFSLSVSVQTLPFCQAHRSTTPRADVPFRGSKTYSCTGWTVKSLSHLPSQKIKKYISVFKKITLGGTFTKKKCSKFTFLPGPSINYSIDGSKTYS